MAVAHQACTALTRTVQQGGMVGVVLEHPVAAPEQGRHGTEVRHVAGREQQGPGPLHEVRKRLLEFMVGARVPGDQMRRTAAGAVFIQAAVKCRNHLRVVRETQVVVAAERQVRPAIDVDIDALGTVDDLPLAVQAVRPAGLKGRREILHARGSRHAAARTG